MESSHLCHNGMQWVIGVEPRAVRHEAGNDCKVHISKCPHAWLFAFARRAPASKHQPLGEGIEDFWTSQTLPEQPGHSMSGVCVMLPIGGKSRWSKAAGQARSMSAGCED